MPVYQPVFGYVEAAIRSILAQDFRALELIIIEDPSESSVRAVVDRLDDERVLYVANERRTSLVEQHNQGLRLARGEFIGRMDSDDVTHPSRISRSLELLAARRDVSLVGSWIRFIDDDGLELGVRRYPTESGEIVRAMARINPLANSSVLFRRAVVDAIGGWTEGTNGTARDYEWFSRAALRGFRFANIAEPLLDYRLHRRSMKSTRLKKTLTTTLEVKRDYWRDRMNVADRLTYAAESLLLHAPDSLVMALFLLTRGARLRPRKRGGSRI